MVPLVLCLYFSFGRWRASALPGGCLCMPVGPALSLYSGTPMGTLATGYPNPLAYICAQKSIWVKNRIWNARWLEKLLGCQGAKKWLSPVLRLKPWNRLRSFTLVRADDGIWEVGMCLLEHAPGLPHVYDGIAQVGWVHLSLLSLIWSFDLPSLLTCLFRLTCLCGWWFSSAALGSASVRLMVIVQRLDSKI